MFLSNNIRFLRKRAGLSQEQLAKKFGYNNFTTIQKWESEKSDPPLKVVKSLSELFLVSMDDLVNKDLTIEPVSIPSHFEASDEAKAIARAYDQAPEAMKDAVSKLLDVKRVVLTETDKDVSA